MSSAEESDTTRPHRFMRHHISCPPDPDPPAPAVLLRSAPHRAHAGTPQQPLPRGLTAAEPNQTNPPPPRYSHRNLLRPCATRPYPATIIPPSTHKAPRGRHRWRDGSRRRGRTYHREGWRECHVREGERVRYDGYRGGSECGDSVVACVGMVTSSCSSSERGRASPARNRELGAPVLRTRGCPGEGPCPEVLPGRGPVPGKGPLGGLWRPRGSAWCREGKPGHRQAEREGRTTTIAVTCWGEPLIGLFSQMSS